jgi:subtilisin family serine protease
MRKLCRQMSLVLVFTLLFATCAFASPTINLPWQGNDFITAYEPDQIIVKFKNGCTAQEKEAKKQNLGLSKMKDIGDTDAELLQITKGEMNNILNQLERSGDVEYAVPNYRFLPAGSNTKPGKKGKQKTPQPLGDPNDTLFSRQWALTNTGQEIVNYPFGSLVQGTVDIDINAPDAWDSIESSEEVLVGVLDTGVDIYHPDLCDNIWINPGEIAGDGIDNDNNGYVDDVYGWNFAADNNEVFNESNPSLDGHGTGVAGVIAASANNNFGIAGIAPNAKIVCLKFIGDDGVGLLSDAIEALDYARQQGIKVINASWGGYFPTRASDPQYYKTELKPLEKAILQSKALFIAAAGNEGQNLDTLSKTVGLQYFPAAFDCPNVISVTAVDNNGLLCSLEKHGWASNIGAKNIDLAAPGSNILSTITIGDYFGAAVEATQGSSRTATWGFGLQDIAGLDKRASLVSLELQFLYPKWNPDTGKNAPSILLVDDDSSEASYPECNKYWTEVFNELNIKYDEYIVPTENGPTDNGPAVDKMKNYDLVVWQTGRSGGNYPPLTTTNTNNLKLYIEQGGNLLLSGENAISGNEDWAAEVLQTQFIDTGGMPWPFYDLTGLPGSTYEGFHCILDGSDLGTPPVFHDLYCPANPETSRSGLAFKFTYISGTSIAAPHVAGVAALLYGKNPHKAPPTIRQELLKSAQPLPELKGKIQSGGIVDAYAALNQTGKRK